MSQFHWPGFDSLGKLSAEETAELAARVADLTRAGLPLGDGLRAMAAELSGGRLRGVLRALADRLDAGEDLPSAMESQTRRLPACLRGLVLAGLRSGRLAEALEEYVDIERDRSELRHRLWLSLAYPFFLLTMLALLVLVGRVYFVAAFVRMFRDFGMKLPFLTEVVIAVSWPAAIFFIALAASFLMVPLGLGAASGISWLWPLLHRVPVIGPLVRWSHLSQFARLMGLLLDQQVALPDALRLAAAGLRDPYLAVGCRRVADEVERGRVLFESMAECPQFPAGMIPLIEWGQRAPALADAFRAIAEMFEGRIRSQGSILEALLVPLMLLLILSVVGVFVVAMFLPLIQLVTCLSGGSH